METMSIFYQQLRQFFPQKLGIPKIYHTELGISKFFRDNRIHKMKSQKLYISTIYSQELEIPKIHEWDILKFIRRRSAESLKKA